MWLKSLRQTRMQASAQPIPLISSGALFRPFALLLVLTLSVLISAFWVIQVAYDYRRLFHDHQVLVDQWDELQVEWGQLLLEQSTWAGHGRIETEAETRMGMRVPRLSEIEMIRHER